MELLLVYFEIFFIVTTIAPTTMIMITDTTAMMASVDILNVWFSGVGGDGEVVGVVVGVGVGASVGVGVSVGVGIGVGCAGFVGFEVAGVATVNVRVLVVVVAPSASVILHV